MKKLYLILVCHLAFMACKQPQPSFIDPEAELPLENDMELDIETFIDLYAGHPYDETLPDEFYGVSDEEMEETHPRNIRRLFNEGSEYALKQLSEPRLLFAVGRAAYFYDHEQTQSWLQLAADNGSVGAKAYLAYHNFDNGEVQKALSLMREAKNQGFFDPELSSLIELAEKSVFDPDKFNQPTFIEALYRGDPETLKSKNLMRNLYVGALHNALWSSDILFVAENPELLLELDPIFSVAEGRQADNAITNQLKELVQMVATFLGLASSGELDLSQVAILEQALQDARRLALLYDNNPKALKKVYAGMLIYSQGA